MDSPDSDATSTVLPEVSGKETEGICDPSRCEQAPSSSGTGRSDGKVVSILGQRISAPSAI
jgi:hypothetical protein